MDTVEVVITEIQQRMGTYGVSELFVWIMISSVGESQFCRLAVRHTRSGAYHSGDEWLLILDYMVPVKILTGKESIVNGGSGGGTQTVLLSALDDPFTASAPVVSLTSHFDGGCL